MNIKQNYKKIIATSLILNVILVSVCAVLVLSQPSNTFTITSGVYPSTPSFTVWKEGSNYYAKNEYGQMRYSGTNCSALLITIIDELPTGISWLPVHWGNISAPNGWIHFKIGEYILDKYVTIPLGARLKLTGEMWTFQASHYGYGGGSQIKSNDADGIFIMSQSGTLINSTVVNGAVGTFLNMENLELVQNVEQTNGSSYALNLNAMVQGNLKNVVVTSYKTVANFLQGRGISLLSGGLGDYAVFENVAVFGFTVAFRYDAHHLVVKDSGFGNSDVCLMVDVASSQIFENIHFFSSYKAIVISSGSRDENSPIVSITNLDLESVGYTVGNCWGGTGGRKFIIHNVRVSGTVLDRLWTFTNKTNWEFHNVDYTSNITTRFPNTTAPSLATNTDILNPNPNVCEVYITGGTVTAIEVNNVDTGLTSGTFTVGGFQTINVTYSSTPSWVWRSIDVNP